MTTATDLFAAAERCLRCQDPVCIDGCPVGIQIDEFIMLVADGDMDDAVMWYARGYYYEAKRLGLLEETGLR